MDEGEVRDVRGSFVGFTESETRSFFDCES